MEGIQNNVSSTKYIQYGNHTFVDVTDQLQKREGPVQMSVYAPSAEEKKQPWRPYFTSGTLLATPSMSQAYQEIEAQMDDAVDQFFCGQSDGGRPFGDLLRSADPAFRRL